MGASGRLDVRKSDAMVPLYDLNPTLRTPVMTILLIILTAGVWVLVQGAGSPLPLAVSVCNFGLVPGEVSGMAAVGSALDLGGGLACVVDDQHALNLLTPVLSMFLHGSWAHLIGNLWFLWVFGNNVEDGMGRARFLAFYLLTGLAAAGLHIAVEPTSIVPTVGASGAISGVMGAYLMLHPRAPVRTWLPPIFLFNLPAWIFLIYWFALQVLGGLPGLSRGPGEPTGGVAFWAHVGGFVAGALLVRFFDRPELLDAQEALKRQQAQRR